MDKISYTIRKMTPDDVLNTQELRNEAVIPECTQNLNTWLQVDKEGFNIAVTDTGEVIGACCAIIHSEDLVFLGMYAVREKYRGLGIGKKLWDLCLDHIGGRNVVLNTLANKTELFRIKGGFPILETEFKVNSYMTYDPVDHQSISDELPEGVVVRQFEKFHLPSMFEYDLNLMGYSRELALKLSCEERDTSTFVASKDGKCVGFGSIKLCSNGLGQVGPLYADDAKVAEVIFKKLVVSTPRAKGYTMITTSRNVAAKEMMDRLKFFLEGQHPRLYLRERYVVDLNKMFGMFTMRFSPF